MPHRILIVDERDADRGALEQYLGKALGYEVTAAAGAPKAIEAAMADDFNLAILSTGLQDVTGIEIYMRLQAIQPDIQAIFFTGDRELSETDKDFLKFSVPENQVIPRPGGDFSALTRLIIGILGPPIA